MDLNGSSTFSFWGGGGNLQGSGKCHKTNATKNTGLESRAALSRSVLGSRIMFLMFSNVRGSKFVLLNLKANWIQVITLSCVLVVVRVFLVSSVISLNQDWLLGFDRSVEGTHDRSPRHKVRQM